MKILLISYYYPPMGGAGVQRALKFSKYLPQHGITPIVIACDDQNYVQDKTLLDEIPAEVEVHRIKFSPIISRLASHFSTRSKTTQKSNNIEQKKLLNRIFQATRDKCLISMRTLQTPDEAIFWAQKALKHARAVIKDHARQGNPIDLIISSSPPVSSHFIAESLARDFNLPWIADYRDLWTENPAYALPKWRRALDVRTEKRWLMRVTGVITVTPTWQRMLASRTLPKTPVKMIPNGYDETDFHNLSTASHKTSTFTIVHTGTFYGPRGPESLLEGIEQYLKIYQTHINPQPCLSVRLIGNMGTRFSNALQAFNYRHPGVLDVIPYMPHSQALSELMAADALLLVIGGGKSEAARGWLPGKIFEYLRVDKPILAIGDTQGDAAQLIKLHSNGIVVSNGDSLGLARAIDSLVSGRTAQSVLHGEKRQPATMFERNELTRQLAQFIRECQSRHLRATTEIDSHE